MNKCFANILGNCSSKISKEHFISKSLLELSTNNNGKVDLGGIFNPNDRIVSPINICKSKILCEKHNTSLSYLDGRISSLVKQLIDFNRYDKDKEITIDGKTISLWLIKTFLGTLTVRNQQDLVLGGKDQLNHLIKILFKDISFSDEIGFILKKEDPPKSTHQPNGIPSWVISNQKSGDTLVGCTAWFYPFSFTFLITNRFNIDSLPYGCQIHVKDKIEKTLSFKITW